jgi:hypothetical protein
MSRYLHPYMPYGSNFYSYPYIYRSSYQWPFGYSPYWWPSSWWHPYEYFEGYCDESIKIEHILLFLIAIILLYYAMCSL